MKKFLALMFLTFAVFCANAQDVTRTKVMSRIEANNDYSYYEFLLNATTTDYLTRSHDSLAYEVSINKHHPAEVQFYLKIDTIATPDSMNVDILYQTKVFDSESWTTIKTITWDGDGTGDYAAAIRDSTHLGAEVLILSSPVFARQARLLLKPTSGAGIGVTGCRAAIRAVEVKIHELR